MLSEEDDEEDDEVGEVLTLPLQAHHAMEKMEEFVHKVIRLFQSNRYFRRHQKSQEISLEQLCFHY